jgi:hypothetical protein
MGRLAHVMLPHDWLTSVHRAFVTDAATPGRLLVADHRQYCWDLLPCRHT